MLLSVVSSDDSYSSSERGKGKDQVIPPELREQWQKDRDKKAENKRARALARLQLAADPLSIKKGGKKGRKAMLAAARLNPTITVLPNRIIDMTTLEQQIRRFVANLGGPSSMSLPPMDKGTRKDVHELANAFNLKSLSKGKGDARYTTLTKTTRSGIGVNEKKVAKIVRRSGGGVFMGPEGRDNGKNKVVVPRHKDGDEVGKVRCFKVLEGALKIERPGVCTIFPGCPEDWRIEHWLQDIGINGLDGGRSDRSVRWARRADHCSDQEHETGLGSEPVNTLSTCVVQRSDLLSSGSTVC